MTASYIAIQLIMDILRTPSLSSFVERLSSFIGYFIWSVYRKELLYCSLQGGCPLSECPL